MTSHTVWSEPSALADGELLVRHRPGAIEVSFNRPHKLNAFTDAMYDGLEALCESAAEDSELRIVVLKGAGGRAFAAGNDIASFAAMPTGQEGAAYERRIRRVLDGIEALPQVTVAVVEGICVGGGLGVAAACDLRVATPAARFGYPIARTLGNVLSASLVLRCRDVFGDALTREMLLASRLVDGTRAYSAGAVCDLVPDEHLEDVVEALIEGVRASAPMTVHVTKQQLAERWSGYDTGVDDARLVEAYGSADFREGVRAFLAKERPSFGAQ